MPPLRPWLTLLRPANVATALADILAGYAVAGLGAPAALPWLLSSTACLYGGGVVLNDVFDRDIDRIERPERPIPSRQVCPSAAGVLGAGLLIGGVALAFAANAVAGAIAAAIAAAVFLYDARGKRHDRIGPLNMALCRALNLLLGVAAVPGQLDEAWPLAAIPFAYIWAVTTLSRGEVHGARRAAATAALIVMVTAWLALIGVAARAGRDALPALVLGAALGWRVLPAFWRARRSPEAMTIRRAVGRGVLSLVVLDATLAAAHAGALYAAVILALGILAGLLGRGFAVT